MNYKRHYLTCSFNPVENRNLDNNRVASNIEGLTKNDDDKVLANIWDNVHKDNRPWNIIIPHSPDSPDTHRGFYNSNSPDHNRSNLHSPANNHRSSRNANNHRSSRNPDS